MREQVSGSGPRRLGLATVLAVAAMGMAGVPASAAPTCADVEPLDIEVHGHHVLRDYVMGAGSLDWPPGGDDVGAAVAGTGAAVPGGPGPGFHFEHGFSPGASFCLPQSNAPAGPPGTER